MNGETTGSTRKRQMIRLAATALLLAHTALPVMAQTTSLPVYKPETVKASGSQAPALPTMLAKLQPQAPDQTKGASKDGEAEAPKPVAQKPPKYEVYHADLLLFVVKKNPKLGAKKALASTKALVAGARSMARIHGKTTEDWLPLIVGVAKQESTFHPKATSYADARGIMQVHWPTWGKKLTGLGLDKDDLYDPAIGAQCGTAILAMYINEAKGSIPGALYKYYGTRDKNYAAGVLRGALEFVKFRQTIPEERRRSLLAALEKSVS